MKGYKWRSSDKTCDPFYGADIEKPIDCIRKMERTLDKKRYFFNQNPDLPSTSTFSVDGLEGVDALV